MRFGRPRSLGSRRGGAARPGGAAGAVDVPHPRGGGGWGRGGGTTVAGLVATGLIIAALGGIQDRPNPTIAALLLLLVVLATATAAHLRVAIAVSVAAMFAFNFFLLPPFHTLTIADPQNWVALFVFVVVAIIASQLSAAVRQRASEAE